MSTITSAIQYLALNYARDLVIFTALLLAMSIQCLVVTQVVNHGWRRDIKRHLPTIQRQELQERDTEIQRLAERVEQLRQDNEILTTTVRAS
ncbi:MAG: hypothetical protein QGG64_10050, partial [Candidatus Latescibacteria bacterium]|nr:hypothetical protein [Candidatus Latescibacterota bacterium]